MTEPSYFTPEELARWRFGLRQADDNNVFCHCHRCDGPKGRSLTIASHLDCLLPRRALRMRQHSG